MDNLDFSEEEIQEQLTALGYKNIPKHRLREFKQDLDDLVRRGEWKSFASSARVNPAKPQTAASQPSPPAFTKEKVGRCSFQSSAEGFFLHDRQVLSSCQNRDYGRQQGRWDSYAQHSVALNPRLPPGAPSRLQVEVEPDPDESLLHPPLTDSRTSTPDSHRARFIKRKVLRKHKGQSLVCDESVYSEEAPSLSRRRSHTSAGERVANMYKAYSAQWDDDKNSLSSSFWSDGGRQEEEEEEEKAEIGRAVGEGDLKPVGNAERSNGDASGEEVEEVEIGEEDSKAVGVSEDSYREASGEEEVQVERGIGEEESKPVTDAEESLQEASEEEEEEDSNPLSDSEDSYQDDSEESEQVISEDDSKSLTDAEDYRQETSEEEEEDDSKPPGNSEDSHQEGSEEIEQVISEEEPKSVGDAEEHLEEASEKEDSKPLGYSEDSHQEDSEGGEGVEGSKPLGYSEDSHQEGSEGGEGLEGSKPVGDADDHRQEASEQEEDSTPLGDSEDSHQEDSEEIEEESKSVGNDEVHLQEASEKEEEEDSNPLSNSEDPYQEDSEEEGVAIEQVISEEDSKPLTDAEDYLQEASVKEDAKPLGYSEDSHQEDSEGGEGLEGSKPFGDVDDHLQEASKEEDDSNPLDASEDSHQEDSEEETPELNNQVNISGGGLEGGNSDDDEDERCSSRSDSPAPSLMTSGYGTYKPEELEGGDDRDDHTITEFDQDSRGDLSEMRDDEEDDRSLCSFGWFDFKPAEPDHIETRPTSVSADAEPEADVALCGDDDLHNEVDVTEEDQDQAKEEEKEEEEFEVDPSAVTTSGEQQFCNPVVEDEVDVKNCEGGRDDEMLEEDAQDREEERDVEDKVELEDPDESSSNKDIKFIDSKVFSQMTFDKTCEDWEEKLRLKTASSLEERLSDLRLSSPARRDFETENEEDVTGQTDGQSSDTDGVSLSAFESYIRGMTRTRSDGDLRPKPKSFIRPAMSQQTMKKTDPVAKYFKYKQLWEMFKLPGEKDRRSLRWEIKERLAYQPPPPKPRRVYEPNTYTVPTEKKRSALRWEIRTDLANGLLPHKFSYQA